MISEMHLPEVHIPAKVKEALAKWHIPLVSRSVSSTVAPVDATNEPPTDPFDQQRLKALQRMFTDMKENGQTTVVDGLQIGRASCRERV